MTQISVVGQSMGTASALHVAANRKVGAVLLMAPLGTVNDLLDAIRRQAPFYVSVKGDASLEDLPLARKALCEPEPNATGTTGDDRNLAFEGLHADGSLH